MDGTKSSMGAAADTKLLEDTAREGMSLIDRFYNGGNRARPAALDILVVVLDGVVRRMRQSYATRQTNINEGNEKIKRLDESIASIKLRQGPLQAELDKKKARAAELKAAVTKGEQVILDSVAIAKAATTKAGLLQRHIENDYIAGEKLCAPLPLFSFPRTSADATRRPPILPTVPTRATTAGAALSPAARSTFARRIRSARGSRATWRMRTTQLCWSVLRRCWRATRA